MTLGDKIQMLRKKSSLSQEKFAEIMNVSRQAVSKWELDQSYPEMNKLIDISDYFGISLDYLVRDINTDNTSVNDKRLSITTKDATIREINRIIKIFWISTIVIAPVLLIIEEIYASLFVILASGLTTLCLTIIKTKHKKDSTYN